MTVDKLLRSIKRSLPALWRLMEAGNNIAVGITWCRRRLRIDELILQAPTPEGIRFISVDCGMLEDVHGFLNSLDDDDLEYFQPFEFSRTSLRRVISGGGFRCFAAVREGQIVGFFFLRLAAIREAYLGFAVHKDLRGLGLGGCMLAALVDSCGRTGVKLLSTVSERNEASMKSHEKNRFIRMKQINDGYWLMLSEGNDSYE